MTQLIEIALIIGLTVLIIALTSRRRILRIVREGQEAAASHTPRELGQPAGDGDGGA